jgi:cytochrome c peroxidase
VTQDSRYRDAYRDIFGAAPEPSTERASPYGDASARAAWSRMDETERQAINRAFANVGKAFEAYVRVLVPGKSRFDRYVDGSEQLTADEIAGLRLFIDGEKTRCLRCHNGPLLTNENFHDVATTRLGPIPDLGRFLGIQSLLLDDFNCQGRYSDAPRGGCTELEFLRTRELGETAGQFKTPTLRDVARTAPYFHDGSVPTLAAVMEHYRRPPPDSGSELLPLNLTDQEAAQLVAFLGTLSGGVAAGAPVAP